jgi:hypothetical protein
MDACITNRIECRYLFPIRALALKRTEDDKNIFVTLHPYNAPARGTSIIGWIRCPRFDPHATTAAVYEAGGQERAHSIQWITTSISEISGNTACSVSSTFTSWPSEIVEMFRKDLLCIGRM